MDRQTLETSATSAALVLLTIMLFGCVTALADGIFAWNLLSDAVEKVALFLMLTLGVTLVCCVLVSIMLNLSIIAQKVAQAVDQRRDPSAMTPRSNGDSDAPS